MSPELERQKRLHNHIMAMHLGCTFVLIGTVLDYLNVNPQNMYPTFLIYFFALSLLFLVEILILRDYNESRLGEQARGLLYTLFPTVVAALVLFITGDHVPYAKVVLLLPVLTAGSLAGRGAAYGTGTFAGLALWSYDVWRGTPPAAAANTNFVLLAIIALVAWYAGGLAELEENHRHKLTRLMYTDDLTGVYNQRYLYERLTALDREASALRPLSLVFIDVDNFKYCNDVFGHQQGDRVLAAIGGILQGALEPPAFAARYGGEEFVAVLPGCSTEKAAKVAEKIRRQVEGHPFFTEAKQEEVAITVSCGVASLPTHAPNYKELIKRADHALYEAKSLKKNRVCVYSGVFEDLLGAAEEKEKELINSVQTLVSVINAKDQYTYGHSLRVLRYASDLAKRLHLGTEEARLLRCAAFLHDVGKLEIDRYLLNKVEALTEQDLCTLRQHPCWGSEIVGSIPALREIAGVILYHHENYDGSGYPAKLRGAGIPLPARIIRVADSYDAMTTDRPYRKAMSPQKALEEIRHYAGTWYDPQVVEAFRSLLVGGKGGATLKPSQSADGEKSATAGI
jgi:diguanylate cyclase (GGDEF)-like protein